MSTGRDDARVLARSMHSWNVMKPTSTSLALILCLGFAVAAHAGDVVVTTSGGALGVKGSVEADVLQIDQLATPPGAVRVTPGPGTTINGSALPQVFANAAGGLKVGLGAGDDELTLNALVVPGKVALDLGDGADTLTSAGLTLEGDLTLKGGKGPDAVSFEATSAGGKMKCTLGEGTDAVALCDAQVAKGIAVDLGAGGPGMSTKSCGGAFPATGAAFEGNSLAASGIIVGAGGITVKGGAGNDSFASSLMSIQGDVKISLANGRGGFSMCESVVTGSVNAKLGKPGVGDTTAWCRKGGVYDVTVTAQTLFVVAELGVGGDFKVKSSTGNDAGAAYLSVFGGTVKLDYGAGLNNAFLQAGLFGEDLIIKTGKGSDVVRVLGSQVAGDNVITLGDGTNDLVVGGTGIGGDLSVKAGAGDDTIDVSTAIVTGTTTVNADGGVNVVTP